MTEKQMLFCSYYIQTLNATESYKNAYPNVSQKTAGANGSRLLENAEIKKYIEDKMKNKNKSTIASEDEVLETITEILRDKQARQNDRLKAGELLGKRYGTWLDRIENTNINKNLDMTNLTEEQLNKILDSE